MLYRESIDVAPWLSKQRQANEVLIRYTKYYEFFADKEAASKMNVTDDYLRGKMDDMDEGDLVEVFGISFAVEGLETPASGEYLHIRFVNDKRRTAKYFLTFGDAYGIEENAFFLLFEPLEKEMIFKKKRSKCGKGWCVQFERGSRTDILCSQEEYLALTES